MTDPIKGMRWMKYPLGNVTQWFGENPELYKQIGLAHHNGWDGVKASVFIAVGLAPVYIKESRDALLHVIKAII